MKVGARHVRERLRKAYPFSSVTNRARLSHALERPGDVAISPALRNVCTIAREQEWPALGPYLRCYNRQEIAAQAAESAWS